MTKSRFCVLIGLPLFLILTQSAMVYVGPGAGLAAIGSALALIGGVFLAILGFFWYPVKRLFRGLRKLSGPRDEEGDLPGESPVP